MCDGPVTVDGTDREGLREWVRQCAARVARLEQALRKLVEAIEALTLAGEADDYMMFEEALDDYWDAVFTAKREALELLGETENA